MNNLLLVLITCSNVKQAKKIGTMLLKKRLVACINILDPMHSVYFWPPGKGTIEEARETILICKTIDSKWSDLEREVQKTHSYDTPEIAALPVSHINKKYYDWLRGELI